MNMNIKQHIINCDEMHVYITAHQAVALRSQCSDAEWAAYTADSKRAGKGCMAIINRSRVLGSGRITRSSFPGVDE